MAWTTFPTLTDGQILTGAHMQLVRDNLNETAVAKATTSGSLIVVDALNALVERTPAHGEDFNSETTTSTTYTNLATVGPAVTVTTGSKALVFFTADINNNTVGSSSLMSVAVSGATTQAADDNYSVYAKTATTTGGFTMRASSFRMFTGLTPGSNTFTAKYRVNGGTGTFNERYIFVMPL